MLSVFERYLTKELFITCFAVVFVLFVVMASNTFSVMMQRVAEGQLAAEDLLWMMVLESVYILVSVLPVATFFAVMVVLGRWYRDSEMVAAQSVGVGLKGFNQALFKFSLPVLLITSALAFYAMPLSEQQRGKVEAQSKEKAQSKLVSEGQFMSLGQGKAVIYAEWYDETGKMQNVFVQGENKTRDMLESANTAKVVERADGRVMRFEQGEVQNLNKVNHTTTHITYASHEMYLDSLTTKRQGGKKWRKMETWALLKQTHNHAQAELHRRIAIPFSIMVLILVALPLSHMRPRQGRFAKMGVGLLVVIVYSNLILVARREIENGLPWGAMYAVHGAMLLFAMYLFYRRGAFARRQSR